jgi:hypothetical protein
MRWCSEETEMVDAKKFSRAGGRRSSRHLATFVLGAALAAAGCSDGGSSGGKDTSPPPPPPPPPPPSGTSMVIDRAYTVAAGSRLVNRGATPARIEVLHVAEDGSRTVVLREGAADLHN